jgi:hypothetical protein
MDNTTDIENRVIGLILASSFRRNAVLDDELAGVGPELFDSPFFRDIFIAAMSLHERGIGADTSSVYDELVRTGKDWIDPAHIRATVTTVLEDPMPGEDQAAMLPEYVKLLQERRTQAKFKREQDKRWGILEEAVVNRVPFEELVTLAQSFHEAQTGDSRHYQFLTPAQLRERPKPQLLIDQLFPAEGVSVIHGESGKGKTQVTLDMAAHVTLGRRWRGHRVKQGPVWYVAADGAYATFLNIEAWTVRNGVDLPYLLTYDQPINLCERGEVANLVADIERAEEKPVWVIVDTLSRTSIGYSDSGNADMARYSDSLLRISRACGGQATVIHHNGRNDKLRGATAIQANTDTVIEVGGDSRNGAGTIDCRKQRGGWEPFKTIGFRTVQVQLGYEYDTLTGVVAEDAGAPIVKLPSLSETQRQVVDVLVAAYPDWLTFTQWWKKSGVKARSTFTDVMQVMYYHDLREKDDAGKYRASGRAMRQFSRNQAAGPEVRSESEAGPTGLHDSVA